LPYYGFFRLGVNLGAGDRVTVCDPDGTIAAAAEGG
jgi:hypothetical protein